jgi:glycosyltransferase involved in cell wall biosynthesis
VLVGEGTEVTLACRFANPDTPILNQARQIPIRVLTTPFAGDLRLFRPSTAWAMVTWPLRFLGKPFDALYTFDVSRFSKLLARWVRPCGWVIGNVAGDLSPDDRSRGQEINQILNGLVVETRQQADVARNAWGVNIPIRPIPFIGHYKATVRRRQVAKPLRVAFMGRYHAAKGVHRLLDIWPQLNIQPARLDFYGHGPEREEVVARIKHDGLSSSVAVQGGWGDSEELACIFAETDLLVLPSETEGFPVILMEAMAHGVPFVATDVGAVRVMAENNPDVRVVPLDNGALKAGIEQMVSALRAGTVLGARLQEYHRNRYSHEVLAHQWSEALLNPERFWEASAISDD